MNSKSFSQRTLMAAASDAQAFAMAQEVDKRNLIGRLLDDKRTEAFSPEIVRWLYEALKQESSSGRHARDALRTQECIAEAAKRDLALARVDIKDLQAKIDTMEEVADSNKAIVKMSGIIARQAIAITAANAVREEANYPDELVNLMSEWQDDFEDVIEEARNVD